MWRYKKLAKKFWILKKEEWKDQVKEENQVDYCKQFYD